MTTPEIVPSGDGSHPISRCERCFRPRCYDSVTDPDLPLPNGHNRRCRNCGLTWNAAEKIAKWFGDNEAKADL